MGTGHRDGQALICTVYWVSANLQFKKRGSGWKMVLIQMGWQRDPNCLKGETCQYSRGQSAWVPQRWTWGRLWASWAWNQRASGLWGLQSAQSLPVCHHTSQPEVLHLCATHSRQPLHHNPPLTTLQCYFPDFPCMQHFPGQLCGAPMHWRNPVSLYDGWATCGPWWEQLKSGVRSLDPQMSLFALLLGGQHSAQRRCSCMNFITRTKLYINAMAFIHLPLDLCLPFCQIYSPLHLVWCLAQPRTSIS